jgi:peptidoglycan/LPS O-acetylase OafA/YrhL
MSGLPSKTAVPLIRSHASLRGIAASGVFFGHFFWNQTAGVGGIIRWAGCAVDLFFILSGFILNWVYLSPANSFHWSSYLRARVARIVPLYYFTTLLFLPIPLYSMFRHGISYVGQDYPATLATNLFMVSGILDGWNHTINIPAWSIGVEFFCYLSVFPLLMWLGRFLAARSYGVAASVLLVLVLTAALVHAYKMEPIAIYHWSWDSSWLSRGIYGFSIGFFLCLLYRASLPSPPGTGIIHAMLLASLALFPLAIGGYIPSQFLLCAFPLLVFATAYDRGAAAAILNHSLFQWLGERSYSIYLWHMPVLTFFRFLLAPVVARYIPVSAVPGFMKLAVVTCAVLLVSELSYRYFEAPCRAWIRRGAAKMRPMPVA